MVETVYNGQVPGASIVIKWRSFRYNVDKRKFDDTFRDKLPHLFLGKGFCYSTICQICPLTKQRGKILMLGLKRPC